MRRRLTFMSASKRMPYCESCWKRNLAFLFVNNDLTRNRTPSRSLQRPLGVLSEFARVNRPARLPAVLTPEETRRVLVALKPGTNGLIIRLLYGTGMRLMECLRLRVKDVDFARAQIVVREGKGDKD